MLINLFVLCALISNLNIERTDSLVLKKVVILSRHNVRTPLSNTLSQISPKPWPHWNEKTGYLTAKGRLLEGFMGEYFSFWLRKEGLLPNDCPSVDNLYVYANTAERTLVSAKSFVKNGFPNCKIKIHYANKTDPNFTPYIHNSSSIFIREALDIMNQHIKDLHLNKSYEMMEQILDYKKSENCVKNKHCDLATDINKANVKTGTKPYVAGPLKISKSAIDSFVMENYEGFNTKDVAWGELDTDKRWDTVMELSKQYHNVVFNLTLLSKDISKPMIGYIRKTFLNKPANVTLIMGHDANIYTVLNAIGCRPYLLKDQYEVTPAGGKLVFQKWVNKKGIELFRLQYVYQGSLQMRNGVRLTPDNPPIFHLLELDGCEMDQDGFCPWQDFVRILNTV